MRVSIRYLSHVGIMIGIAISLFIITYKPKVDYPHHSQQQQRILGTAEKEDLKFSEEQSRAKLKNEGSFSVLELDPSSVLFPDLVGIHHYPSLGRVDVTLKNDGRCPRPVLKGRLSGPALIVIEWEEEVSVVGDAQYVMTVGHYGSPLAGDYYLEIIVLLCSPLGGDGGLITQQHIQSVCLEDVEHNSLLLPGENLIKVELVDASVLSVGYWKNDRHGPPPLVTRAKPKHCRRDLENTPRCIQATQLNEHNHYQFQWGDELPNDHFFFKYQRYNLNPTKKYDVCTVGGTDALSFAKFTNQVGITRVKPFQKHFPNAVDEGLAKEITDNCYTIILMFGLWSANFAISPTTFMEQMDVLLEMFHKHPGVFVLSTQEVPLEDKVGAWCPAFEWRHPPLIQAYNKGMRWLCRDRGVNFIDMAFITEPMWDSSPDYWHSNGKVAIEVAKYFATIMGFNKSKNVAKLEWAP